MAITPLRASHRRASTHGRVKPGQMVEPTLPVNPEAEVMLIGSVIDWPMAADIIPLIEPDDFADLARQAIWDVIRYELHAKGRPVTLTGVNDALAARGQLSDVGGQNYIISLKARADTALPAREYARIVLMRARDRAMIHIGGELANYAYNSYEMGGAIESFRLQIEEWEQRLILLTNGGAAAALPGVKADEVQQRAVEWLWRRRLAFGKLAILDSDPGMGKGLLGADLAARVSTGRAMPDEDPRTRYAPGNVLLITPEDEADDMIVPRLVAAGADLARVRILNSLLTDEREGGQSERPIMFPRDTLELERVLEAEAPALLIIDPIMACLDPGVKVQNDQEVRAALQPLKLLVARHHTAGLLCRHMNKSGGDKALYRGGGSIAFTGLARVAMLLATHPDDENLVALAGVKSNAGRKPATLSFCIQAEHEEGVPHIVWQEQEVAYTADALLGAKRSDERRDYLVVFQENAQNGVHELTPHDVALALGVPPDQEGKVRKMLRKMVEAGELRQPRYGYYSL